VSTAAAIFTASGAVFYELLVGRRSVLGTPGGTAGMHYHSGAQAPAPDRRSGAQELERHLLKALSNAPASGYTTGARHAVDLRQFLGPAVRSQKQGSGSTPSNSVGLGLVLVLSIWLWQIMFGAGRPAVSDAVASTTLPPWRSRTAHRFRRSDPTEATRRCRRSPRLHSTPPGQGTSSSVGHASRARRSRRQAGSA